MSLNQGLQQFIHSGWGIEYMEAEENYILKYEMLKCWALICFRWKFPREWVCLIWMSDFSNLLPTQSDNLICIYPGHKTHSHPTLSFGCFCRLFTQYPYEWHGMWQYLCRGVLPLVDSPVARAGHVAGRPRVGDGGVLLLWHTEYGENKVRIVIIHNHKLKWDAITFY